MSGPAREPTHAIVRTGAGVAAVRSLVEDEVMHPGVGPMVEAERLYVRQSRLQERLEAGEGNEGPFVVFDVGLGAASNAVAARAVSERASAGGARLELVSFERDLGALELALEHGADFGLQGEMAAAARALCGAGIHETARTSWRLERGEIREALERQARRADIVFWDPFSPRANPELWTVAAFQAVRRQAGPRCTLFTYSASTATRVALLLAGWAVGWGDGIGTKRTTTAAAARVEDLERPLDRGWLARLSRPDAPLPPDAGPEAAALVGALPQFSSR